MKPASDFFWLSFGVVMGFFLAGCILWGIEYQPSHKSVAEQHNESKRTDQITNRQPDGSRASPFAVEVIPTPKTAEERAQEAEDREEKKTADKWLVRWTAMLFAATVGLILATGVLGYFGFSQARDMKESVATATRAADVAEKTLIAAHRPWVKIVSIRAAGPLVFEPTPDDHEGRIDLSILLKNVGNSPAIRVSLDVSLVMSNTSNLLHQQKARADALVLSRRNAAFQPNTIQPEITLFPDDQLEIHTVAWMNPDPLAAAREWAGRYPGAIAFLGFIGCVLYESPMGDGFIHETGIVYSLRKRTPYPAGHPLPRYYTIDPNYPRQDRPGAFHLESSIGSGDLDIAHDFVGTGRIN